jgi:uncharacterized Zn-finger protein
VFKQRQNLQQHIRTHTSDKPYKCDLCDMGFRQKGNLQRHIKVHTGDTCKPYKCDVCDIMFTQRKDQQRSLLNPLPHISHL